MKIILLTKVVISNLVYWMKLLLPTKVKASNISDLINKTTVYLIETWNSDKNLKDWYAPQVITVQRGTKLYGGGCKGANSGIDVAGGTWEFSEDKTQVTFNYLVSSVNLDDTQTCTINKLKINSLALILTSNWVGYQSGDKIYYEYY